jgi:uncharacterized membrane protein
MAKLSVNDTPTRRSALSNWKIVAFSVPSMLDGEQALDQLEDVADVLDVALVYKTEKGKVKLRQTSDMTAGKGALRGALVGGLASILVGPFVGMAAAGTAAGAIYGKVRDKGVSDKLMKLAGDQLEAGNAAVFVLAEDAEADRIEAKVKSLSGLKQFQGTIVVGDFPASAQDEVRAALKEHANA